MIIQPLHDYTATIQFLEEVSGYSLLQVSLESFKSPV